MRLSAFCLSPYCWNHRGSILLESSRFHLVGVIEVPSCWNRRGSILLESSRFHLVGIVDVPSSIFDVPSSFRRSIFLSTFYLPFDVPSCWNRRLSIFHRRRSIFHLRRSIFPIAIVVPSRCRPDVFYYFFLLLLLVQRSKEVPCTT